jgi:Domain of unknown function (DUF4276)
VKLGFVVEGETEEAFVKQILRPHLFERGITIEPTHVLNVKGNRWSAVRKLVGYLFGRMGPGRDVRITTLYDLYGIDQKGLGIADALTSAAQAPRKAQIAEGAMRKEILDDRFLAHVSVHELEALIFADLTQVVAVHPECRAGIEELAREVQGLPPEAIDDGRETSPSHRLLRAADRYNKVVDGPSILKRIGLPALRAACPHFASWLGSIEALALDP